MKQCFLFVALFLLGSPAIAQVIVDTTFNRVIRIEGEVYSSNKGMDMNLESVGGFSPGTPLRFGSTDSRIIFISPEKELLMAIPNEDMSGYTTVPIRSKYNTRPGKILSYIAFVKFLEGRDWLVLGDSVHLEVGKEEFPLSEDHFFFIRYQLQGDSLPVNKRLSHQGQQVLFSKQGIFQVDDQPAPIDSTYGHQLFYYDALKPASTLIHSIRLIFPDERRLRAEVAGIIRYLGIAYPKEEKIRAIQNYLFEVYGTPEKENLQEWLKRHFNL